MDPCDDETFEVLVLLLDIASRRAVQAAAQRSGAAPRLLRIANHCADLRSHIVDHWAEDARVAEPLDDPHSDQPLSDDTDGLLDDSDTHVRP